MLTEICKELRNYFDFGMPKWFRRFEITGRTIDLDLKDGQYFRIVGSVFNDGVYRYPATDLIDETFQGAVWAMAVPPAVIALADEIDAWQTQYGSAVTGPYTSESFGGYSYTKAGSGARSGAASDTPTWQSTFASRLSQWRKIRP